jgi:hypothetical protein
VAGDDGAVVAAAIARKPDEPTAEHLAPEENIPALCCEVLRGDAVITALKNAQTRGVRLRSGCVKT